MITIFTPTYNRAHTLPRLYESLKNQTNKDFEWVIVDDGSEDQTKNLVEGFQNEKALNIRYIFKENGGKHTAFNLGVKEAKGKFFVNIDSDDYLVNSAVEKMHGLIKEIGNTAFVGFTFIRFSDSVSYNAQEYGEKRWQKEPYSWEFWGEMQYCIKTEVLRQFPFPVFPGERFCPESLILRRLEQKYDILYTDNVLAKGDYLEEGLTHHYYQLLVKNPHSALLNYKERMKAEPEHKKSLTKQYLDIAFKAKGVGFWEKFFTVHPISVFSFLFKRGIKRA